MFKRIKLIYITFIVLLVALNLRLFYIQIIGHKDLEQGAKSQYVMNLEGLDTRGVIYDRNLVAITDSCDHYYYLILKEKIDQNFYGLLNKLSAEKVTVKDGEYVIYRSERFDKNINKKLTTKYNAYGIKSCSRYKDNQIASHVIGYLNESEKKGVSGIEVMCEDILKAKNRKLCLYADSQGKILNGVELFMDSDIKKMEINSVVLTLDIGLQEKVEHILKDNSVNGSVIISEIESGDILVMASSPTFNPNKVYEHLRAEGDELINKACQEEYDIGRIKETLKSIANREEKKDLASLSMKMGFGEVVLEKFPNEKPGTLPSNNSKDGKIFATPIQVARFLSIFGNKGNSSNLKIIKDNVDYEKVSIINENIAEESLKNIKCSDGWRVGIIKNQNMKYGVTVKMKNNEEEAELVYQQVLNLLR